MRGLTVFLLVNVAAWCQFIEFATTDDGRQIYFTTSLVERTTQADVKLETRIFRIDGRTLRLFVERGELANSGIGSNSDGASSLHVTGDGESVAFILTNICTQGDSCRAQRAEIRGRGAQILGEAYRVLLSRNGQWALLIPPPFDYPDGPFQPPVRNTSSTLVNLTTGERTAVGLPLTADGEWVLASDGSVLERIDDAAGSRQVGIWKNGVLTRIPPLNGLIAFLGLSDDAGTVLAARLLPPATSQPLPSLPVPELVAVDVRSGTARVVHRFSEPGRYILLGLSNDGRRALLRTVTQTGNGPALFVNIENLSVEPITLPDREVVVAGCLSGDGNVPILGTSSGRVLRIVATGDALVPEELLPRTPYVNDSSLLAPGSITRFAPPVAGTVDWTDLIRLNGLPLAMISQSPDELVAQVPWELSVGSATLTVDYPSDSPLIQRGPWFIAYQAPDLPPLAPNARGILGGRLIKGDFSGYATEPPHPGDIVHIYMTGLGAVEGSIQTGQPAPSDELRPLRGTAHCRFTPYPSDTEILFVGLAPGTVGIYQLTFRFGPDTPADIVPSGLECGFNSRGYNFGVFFPSPP